MAFTPILPFIFSYITTVEMDKVFFTQVKGISLHRYSVEYKAGQPQVAWRKKNKEMDKVLGDRSIPIGFFISFIFLFCDSGTTYWLH